MNVNEGVVRRKMRIRKTSTAVDRASQYIMVRLFEDFEYSPTSADLKWMTRTKVNSRSWGIRTNPSQFIYSSRKSIFASPQCSRMSFVREDGNAQMASDDRSHARPKHSVSRKSENVVVKDKHTTAKEQARGRRRPHEV